MSEMVERMVRAMQQRAKEPLGNIETLEPVSVGSLGDAWPYLARAAIEAIREPTSEMLSAATDIEIERPGNDETNSTFELWPKEADGVWRAMVDAALK